MTDQRDGYETTVRDARRGRGNGGSSQGEDGRAWSVVDVARLERTIQTDIIPRLVLAFGDDARGSPDAAPRPSVSQAEVVAFANMIVDREEDAAGRFIDERTARGIGVETILLGLLAPAARFLGEEWENDRRSFVEVTIGLCRMQQLLRRLTPASMPDAGIAAPGHRALFSPSPGEQHTFGLYVVEEFFRRDGWDVWTLASATIAEIESAAADAWYDVAGFSLSGDLSLSQLAQAIRIVRRASRNQGIRVLVGGRAFVDAPDRVAAVDADGTAEDARQAARLARQMVGALTA